MRQTVYPDRMSRCLKRIDCCSARFRFRGDSVFAYFVAAVSAAEGAHGTEWSHVSM